jgi:hypothetical protein
VLYNFVRTSCNATDVIGDLMCRVQIKRDSDGKVADEGPTTFLVVREFTFSKRYWWRFKTSETLRCVVWQIASGDSNYRSALIVRIKQWEFSARSEAFLTLRSLLQAFRTKRNKPKPHLPALPCRDIRMAEEMLIKLDTGSFINCARTSRVC